MALDWTKCAAVESVPGKVSGAWVFRGTRLPVATIFENLEDSLSIEEIMEQFDVTRGQVSWIPAFFVRPLASYSLGRTQAQRIIALPENTCVSRLRSAVGIYS